MNNKTTINKEQQSRMILFGTGIGGKHGFNHVKRAYRVLGFADNDISKHGQRFMGMPVFAPDDLRDMDFDLIVICSMYRETIRKQLMETLDIPFDKIFFLDANIRKYGTGELVASLIAMLGAGVLLSFVVWMLK